MNQAFQSGPTTSHPGLDTAGLPPLVTELIGRLPLQLARELHALAREALPHGALTTAPGAEELDELTHDVRWLLDQIGEQGVKLTAAGYLPAAIVRSTYEALKLQREWPGSSSRESDIRPVLSLRLSLQSLGLLRKAKGHLLLTVAGKKLRADPARLAQHIASRLPMATDEFERIAGTFALLALASGRLADDEDVADLAVAVLMALGWGTRRAVRRHPGRRRHPGGAAPRRRRGLVTPLRERCGRPVPRRPRFRPIGPRRRPRAVTGR